MTRINCITTIDFKDWLKDPYYEYHLCLEFASLGLRLISSLIFIRCITLMQSLLEIYHLIIDLET